MIAQRLLQMNRWLCTVRSHRAEHQTHSSAIHSTYPKKLQSAAMFPYHVFSSEIAFTKKYSLFFVVALYGRVRVKGV